jgi:hypothetical protein
MNRAFRILEFGLVMFAFALATAGAVAQVAYMEKSRSTPQVVVIEKVLPDSAQVCAEPLDGGLVACRSIGEFRKWVREQSKK